MSAMEHNPLLQPSTLAYGLPDFAQIRESHYRPAFEIAMQRHREEIDALLSEPRPTWENTVEAFERSGQDLDRVSAVFFNLLSTDATPAMEELAEEIVPQLAEHSDAIYLNSELYRRIGDVTPPQDAESQRLHEKLLLRFRRHGADLSDAQMRRLREINSRLSVLSERFGRTLKDEAQSLAVRLTDEETKGWSQARREIAAQAAQQAGEHGAHSSSDAEYLVPLQLPTVQSEQAVLEVASARAKLYEASQQRGGSSNGEIVVEMAALRAERAELLGYESHAAYVIAEETAGSVEAVRELLDSVIPAAAANATNERKLLTEAAALEGEPTMTGADWPYWESKVRARDFQLDEDELKHYFPLEQVLTQGVWYAANRLYGLTMSERKDLAGYAEDVRVWEVISEDGEGIGLILTDYFARPSKRGGAWMTGFIEQSELLGTKPVVVNVMNIAKPADGSEALLSIDEVRTLFHEFGHGLHGLLSQVRYPTFSGTNVPRDYVEFPSQINENWAFDQKILRHYARHVSTGEVIPDELVTAIQEAGQFGQGFSSAETLGAAVLDLAWHSLSPSEAAALTPEDVDAFEADALEQAGLAIEGIAPRYRSRYFNHIFAGGYAAGYYSYLWAEVLDADGFDWFVEQQATGPDASDDAARRAGQRFLELVLSRGGADDYTEAFERLRGRAKDIRPLLQRRDLAGAVGA